jgi:CRISPR-associated protein Cmr1
LKSITFECETVTPMFLAGYDGATPELRPPSIKGIMRFWWRAFNGHLSIDKLMEIEGNIFGAADKNIGRSKFNIQVSNNRLAIDEYYVLPHKKTFRSKGFSPGQKFSIGLSCYDNIGEYSDILKISLLLGGLGKRSRRGFGSIRILKVDTEQYNVDFKIQDVLKIINNICADKYKIDGEKIVLAKNISQDYPFVREIQFGGQYPSWEEFLLTIGLSSHACKNDSLGFADHGKRLASPIYASVLKNSSGIYIPIITTLNTAFQNRHPVDYAIQNKFKGMII